MSTILSNRNEDAPFYFEKLVACFDFIELLDNKSLIEKLQIKPDRKYGPDRRIDDITRFNKDKSVEVVQIKYSSVSGKRLGLSDLWKMSATPVNPGGKKEGTNIYKFLKSWRYLHRAGFSKVILTLLSNKELDTRSKKFFAAIKDLETKKLTWKVFSKLYRTELESIKNNCSRIPFFNTKELKNFICSLEYKNLGDIETLHILLEEKLKSQGVVEKVRVKAFINDVTRKFISKIIDIVQADVIQLIDRVKTELIQEIATPQNYIPRHTLENKILDAIESKKKNGGFVFLFSPSGSGKTILLSRLAEHNPEFLPYFCRIRPFEGTRGKSGYLNNDRLSNKWFKVDIIQRCNEFGLITTSVGVTDDENYIDKMFDESLTAISKKAIERPDKKIVIIIDALDQIDTDRYKGKSVLDAIPIVQYPGVVFLLSTWGERYLPTAIKNLPSASKKETGIDLYFSKNEISEYFKNVNISLTEDQLSSIKLKTKGLAISLFYLAKKIKHCHDADVAINATGTYDKVFEWYKPIWGSMGTDERECLGCLCFHFAPVRVEDLRSTVKTRLTPVAFEKLFEQILPFVDVSDGYIEPYHDSFRRFVVSNLAGNKTYYHKKLAQYYSSVGRKSKYSLKYVTRHLELAGIHNYAVGKIFVRLDRDDFFYRVLRSKLDDPTKVAIGKSFATFFFKKKNTKNLVKYSILSSNIYPTIYGDNTYQKAFIGTEKLIAEVETELLAPKGNQEHDQQEWIFRRLSVGNILRKKSDKNSQNIAGRFLDDALFRLNLNPRLLWNENAQQEFWTRADLFTEALVNTGRYLSAIHFLKRRVAFTKRSRRNVGYIGSKVVRVHLHNFLLDRRGTLKQVEKSSKVERLLFYMELMDRKERIPSTSDFKSIINDTSVESYLTDTEGDNQLLRFAKLLVIKGNKKYSLRIKKILDKIDIEVPYYDHGFAYWGRMGAGRETFLDSIALRTCSDSGFNFKKYYEHALKNQFKNRSDLAGVESIGFFETLIFNINLRRARLFVLTGKLNWDAYWELFKGALDIYRKKVDDLKSADEFSKNKMLTTHSPYLHDLSNLVDDNLSFVKRQLPKKIEFVIEKIEGIIGPTNIKESANLLEILVRNADVSNPKLKDKVDAYFTAMLEDRKTESLDNMTKSNNLLDLAMLAATKDFFVLAEDIFEQSLKYSRGLWGKEDLRFNSFVDASRSQGKNELDYVARCIEKAANVVEGGWYWRIVFLESATFVDYRIALNYAYKYIVTGKMNQNDALRTIITAYVRFNSYSSIKNVLPLAALIDFKDENSYDSYQNTSSVTRVLIDAALKNGDISNAYLWISDFFDATKKDLSPDMRINVLRDFIGFFIAYPKLKSVVRSLEKHVEYLLSVGYLPAHESSTKFVPNYDDVDLKKLLGAAKNDSYEKVIKIIDAYVKKPAYFADLLIADCVPYLSTTSIEKIKGWSKIASIDLETSSFYISLLKKAIAENNKGYLRKIVANIYKFQSTAEHFRSSHLINELNRIEFPGKKQLMKRLLLVSISKYAGDNYSLPSLFVYSSDAIDVNFPNLKGLAYDRWKRVIAKSMALSLSK